MTGVLANIPKGLHQGRISCFLVALFCLAGCSERAGSVRAGDYLRLTFNDHGSRAQIFLFAEGAARIHLQADRNARLAGRDSSIVMPALSAEVKRLEDAILAYHGTAIVPANRLFDNAPNKFEISCHAIGREHLIQVSQHELARNRLLNGVVEEFKAVAQFALARAIYDHESAEALVGAGELDSAVHAYDEAASEFNDWESSFCERYGNGIWEPGMNDSLNPKYTLGDRQIEIAGGVIGPTRLIERIGVNQKDSIDLVRRHWLHYLSFDLTTAKSDRTITVTYSDALIEFQEAGMQARVPHALMPTLEKVGRDTDPANPI